jgi:UDP-N-acetylglucosamine 4,6-dehydratase
MIAGKNVLVTGGADSVGRILVHRLLQQDPTVVPILDKSEPDLAAHQSELDDDRCRFLSRNIRDKDRLVRAVDTIDIVVHTVVMKHADISEYRMSEKSHDE